VEGAGADWPELTERLLETDPEGAGALRIVTCAERLERGVADAGTELQAGYPAAAALEDSHAMVHFESEQRPGRS
jgi:hypothetical protein